MVVIPAARIVAFQPGAGLFIEVFADVGLALRVLAVGIGEKGIEVIGRRHDVWESTRHDGRPALGDLVTWTDWEME